MRTIRSLLAAVLAVTITAAPLRPAFAQPVPEPGPPTVTVVDDPAAAQAREIDEFVAQALYDRGAYLYARASYADAKQLFIEALMRSPKGPRMRDALDMLRNVNEKLGVKNLEDGLPGGTNGTVTPVDPYGDGGGDAPPVDPYGDGGGDAPPVDPYGDGGGGDDVQPPPPGRDDGVIDASELTRARRIAALTVGVSGGLIGASITGVVEVEEQSDGGLEQRVTGTGVAAFGVGAFAGTGAGWLLTRHRQITEGQARAALSASLWGSAAGGLLADAGTGAAGTDGNDVVRGAAIGAVLGTGVGVLYARGTRPSVDDVGVINSLAAYGAGAGLLLGMAMNPPEGEAYSINAALGIGAGIGVGAYLARSYDISRRRMLYIDLGAAVGAGAPLLLFAALNDDRKSDDNQAFGFLGAIGLIGGAVLTRRWTSHMDDGRAAAGAGADPAVPALAQRASDGTWSIGGPALRPLNDRTLGPALGRGAAVTLLGGAF